MFSLGFYYNLNVLIQEIINAYNKYHFNILAEHSLMNMKNSYKIITKARCKKQKYRFNDAKRKTLNAPPTLDPQFVIVSLLFDINFT